MTATALDTWTWVTEPYDHQRAGSRFLTLHPRAALLWEMGTGKTKAVIDRCRWGFHAQGWTAVLVVAPNSVVGVWVEQWREHGGLEATALRGPLAKRRAVLARPGGGATPAVFVLNYEALQPLEKALRARAWDCIVFDESTRLKSARAKRTRTAWRLADRTPNVYILTGTPITQSPLDAYGQFRTLGQDVLGFSWFPPFKDRYSCHGGTLIQSAREAARMTFADLAKATGVSAAVLYKWEHAQKWPESYHVHRLNHVLKADLPLFPPSGAQLTYRNLDELTEKIRPYCHVVRKADSLDLPPKNFERRECELTADQRRAYADMLSKSVAYLEAHEREHGRATAPIVLTRLLRLQQITGGWLRLDPDGDEAEGMLHAYAPNPKLALVLELLADLGPESVVIWCQFVHEVEAVAGALADAGRRVGTLYGRTPVAERDAYIRDFQAGRLDTMVGHPACGGLGIQLTAACHCVYYSHGWDADARWQSADRIHRIGQDRPVTYYDLCATVADKPTVDHKVLAAYDRKGKLADQVVNWRDWLKG